MSDPTPPYGYGTVNMDGVEMDGRGSTGIIFDGSPPSLQGDAGTRCECCQAEHASVKASDSTINGVYIKGHHQVCMTCVQNPARLRAWAARL